MPVYTPTEARADFFRLMEHVSLSHEPIRIKGRKNVVVMIDEEDYESLQETLYLQSIPEMLESIKEASSEPLEDAVPYSEIKW